MKGAFTMKRTISFILIYIFMFSLVGCDIDFNINKFYNKEPKLVMGTYYLPYESEYDPTSISFFENGTCTIDFASEKKESYHQNYWVENGKVYLDIDTAPKVHVFTITENALIFDKALSTANLWDTMAYRGPVVYFLSGVSQEEILSTVTMAAEGMDTLPRIERIYGKYEIGNRYNDKKNDMYAFCVEIDKEGVSNSEKVLGTEYTFTYQEGRKVLVYTQGMVLSLNEAFDRELITLDIIKELYEFHKDCSIQHNYDEGAVVQTSEGEIILYTCRVCQDTKTVSLPKDFSFRLTWGFDGYYDSETGHLESGYNYDLGQKCETTLILDHNELMNVYRILYNGGLLEIKEGFMASNQFVVPSYSIDFGYTVDGETASFSIVGASYLSYTKWEEHPEFAYAYFTVINEYIKSSDEYKALPPNQNVYD